MPKKNLKIISLFSGAGGLDIGFDRAGFTTAVAVELDPSCCDTLRTNMPDLPIINKSITEVSGEEILNAAGLEVAENTPVYFGLMAIAGAYMLKNSLRYLFLKEEKTEETNKTNNLKQ